MIFEQAPCTFDLCLWAFQRHHFGDCSADFSHDRSGLKSQFLWHQSIMPKRWLLRKTARGIFKSERGISVLSSLWKSQMHLCIRVPRSNCWSKGDHHVMQPGLFCCGDSLARQYHDLKHTFAVFLVYPSFLFCNSLPQLFKAFSHFMKLPNKGFVLIGTKYLLKNHQNIDSRLKQVLVFFFPPEVVNLRLKSLFVDKL